MTATNFNPDLRFRINKPKVILETFDDELVIINLDSGNYYSLEKTGAAIWMLIEQSASTGEIMEAVSSHYEGERPEIEMAVGRFVGELQLEELLTPVSEPPTASAQRLNIANGSEGRRRFEPPVLHKYTDMRELLLLDPIHEVDESGWPNPSGSQ